MVLTGLDTRVVLFPVGFFRVEIAPCFADIVEGRIDLNLVRCFEELCGQAVGDMPCDMAVHDPSTRVVCLKSKNQPSTSWQHRGVATRRVFEVQLTRLVVGVVAVLFRT